MLDKIPAFLSNLLFFQVYKLIPRTLKKQFRRLLILMLVLACVETAGVGLIAFYAAAVSDPLSTSNLPVILTLKSFPYLGSFFETPKLLIGSLSVYIIIFLPLKNSYRGFVTYRIARSSADIEAYFGQRLLEMVLYRDYRWHLDQNSADLVQMVNWRNHLGRNFVGPSLKVICELMMLFVLLLGLLWTQPLVSTLFILVQGGAVVFVFGRLKKGLDSSASQCRKHELAMNRYATRAIHAIKDVKIAAAEQTFVGNFVSHTKGFSQLFGRQHFWKEAPLLVLESFGFIVLASAILFMLFILDYSPLKTTGTTALLAVTAWRTLPAFNRVVSSLTTLRISRPYVESLIGELQSNPHKSVSSSLSSDDGYIFKKDIIFDHVSFSYDPNHPVLDDFQMKISKGESIGIMGPSGCGKSTFVDLLCGLLKPDSGRVVVDGQILSEKLLTKWWSCIGYVPQHPYIFDGSLAENIAFGDSGRQIDFEEVERCCKLSSIDFLERLPHGLMTEIGERGIRLSGGQRQRVAIARALYRKPQILILDEATSALDEEKDKNVRMVIDDLTKGTTVLIVSHRKSTIEGCDKKIVFV